MKDQIFNKILYEYQQKRDKAQKQHEQNISVLHSRFPELAKLDDEIYELNLRLSKLAITGESDKMPEIKSAIDEKIAQKHKLLDLHGITPQMLKVHHDCQLCKDTGFIEKNGLYEKCTCLVNRLIQEAYKNSNITDKIENENFSNFDISLFDDNITNEAKSPKENMKFLKQISYDFIENFGNKDQKSLLFYGPPGLGKTFLCTSIAKALMDNSKTVLYYSSSELFNRLSDYTFSRETFLKTSSKEIHDLIMDTQLLIIDDLGSEMTNSFVINQLFNILNLREMHARKLIISTNLTPKELNEVYGDRIFSRMVMHFDFYKFYGSDIRWKL